MSIAWLTFIPEDGGAIRGALFETTPGGEPLAFHFTRLAASDDRAVSEISDALLRAASSPPTLALAPPLDAATDSAPFRLVAPAVSPGALPSDVRALLSGLARGEDPSEPFRRAAACLDEAFADSAVRAMLEMSGFRAVITLPPPSYSTDAAASARGDCGARRVLFGSAAAVFFGRRRPPIRAGAGGVSNFTSACGRYWRLRSSSKPRIVRLPTARGGRSTAGASRRTCAGSSRTPPSRSSCRFSGTAWARCWT